MRALLALALLLCAACNAPRPSEQSISREDEFIARGGRLASEQKYEEAQAVYSAGLALVPQSWRLLRYRGHRWITLRQFDKALADLERAWELCRDAPDAPEPEPSPAGSTKANVVYHLALAHYLRGEYAAACATWDAGRGLGDDSDDRRCSSTYWHQLALRRAGRAAEADALLRATQLPASVPKNESYRQLCLLFRGEEAPEALLAGLEPGTTEHATRGYGLACWRALRGEEAEARTLLEQIVARGPKNAFGCVAAEVDLAYPRRP